MKIFFVDRVVCSVETDVQLRCCCWHHFIPWHQYSLLVITHVCEWHSAVCWSLQYCMLCHASSDVINYNAGFKCPSVNPFVHSYVPPSTKSSFDFNEIWHAGRGWWMMHDDMQCDPIQGQSQSHEPFKVRNLAIFKSYLLRHLQREPATDHWFLN